MIKDFINLQRNTVCKETLRKQSEIFFMFKSIFVLYLCRIPISEFIESFYSANDMKGLFQKIEMKNVMSFLKAVNLYGKI